MNVGTAAVSALLATNRIEETPAWAADGKGFVYVTDRNGEREIWLHEPGKGDRPLVTPRDFPAGTTLFLDGAGAFSHGTRVMYLRAASDDRGATPAHLVDVVAIRRSADAAPRPCGAREPRIWSPDSAWYVFNTEPQDDGSPALKKARTSGTSEPETLAVRRSTVMPLGAFGCRCGRRTAAGYCSTTTGSD